MCRLIVNILIKNAIIHKVHHGSRAQMIDYFGSAQI